jgi:hypothetical protein
MTLLVGTPAVLTQDVAKLTFALIGALSAIRYFAELVIVTSLLAHPTSFDVFVAFVVDEGFSLLLF